ncbi:hypothetical protein NKI59_30855 [Mesorhizobium sp. M0598]|uniref:hypothetical protein n=1 Tax=Mesorhizobium sp. M0598 TaxID=2956968 RepID=UPI003335EA9C
MPVTTGWVRISATIALVGNLCWSTAARADLAQLGDALPDVVTFGAWGQSRDQTNAEIERLKLRFAEELQRKSEALIATTRIQERAAYAIDSQQVGQELLKIIAAIDVLLAQEKEIVVERFVVNKNVARFSDWFDTFVEVETDHLDSLVQLLSATTAGDSQSREAALEALKLAKVQQEKDIKEARGHLKSALSSAKSNSVARAMVTLSNIRNQLVLLLEGRRGKLRELVDSMAAEDRARRVLCAPPYVLTVACKEIHTECRYYSADPASPLPCGDLVYLNMFPIEAIQQI